MHTANKRQCKRVLCLLAREVHVVITNLQCLSNDTGGSTGKSVSSDGSKIKEKALRRTPSATGTEASQGGIKANLPCQCRRIIFCKCCSRQRDSGTRTRPDNACIVGADDIITNLANEREPDDIERTP